MSALPRTLQAWMISPPGATELARWRYELRRAGLHALLGPPLALVALGAFALLISFQSPQSVNSILSFGLDLMPLVAAIGATGALAEDDALELQLTLQTSYRSTALRRLTVVLAWPFCLSLAGSLILATTSRLVWPVPAAPDLLSDQLIWLAPALWLAGAGSAATLGLRTMVAGSGMAGLLWMLQEVLGEFFTSAPWRQTLWLFYRYQETAAGDWYVNRAALFASALAFFALAYWLLGRSEYLLREER